jgi:hypothetical protein
MKVFVSWSGSTSLEVAKILKKWVPRSIPSAELFVSDTDIKSGDRWAKVLGEELSERQFAIVCLTSDNATSAWLNFEAGAISKAISESHVVPLLYNLEISNIDGPLSQFQAVKVSREGYLRLLNSLNQVGENKIPQNELEEMLEILWPNVQQEIQNIPETDSLDESQRDTNAILSDVIFSINDLREQVGLIERKVSPTSPTMRLELLSNLFQSAQESCTADTLKEIAEFCQAEVNRIFLERVLSESERSYGQKLRKSLASYIEAIVSR